MFDKPIVHYFLCSIKGFHFRVHNNPFLSIEIKISDVLRYCKYRLTKEKFEGKKSLR